MGKRLNRMTRWKLELPGKCVPKPELGNKKVAHGVDYTMKKFLPSIYLIVPFIFSGITLLTGLVAHHLTLHFSPAKGAPGNTWPIFLLVILLTLLSFAVSLIVLHTVLKPMKKFAEKAARLHILAPAKVNAPATEDYGEKEMEHYGKILENASNLLSKVEARELFPEVIGQSRPMRAVLDHVLKVAPTDETVLLMGESGTGKELVARAIYEHSGRADRPFVALNCVAIPEGLFESELFGHEKGAFTGAVAHKAGKLETAHTGTIFLDEIGDMPPAAQAKLLRVLQERSFERVGGNKTIKVDVRIIAATNKNLMEMVKAGTFREDLFHRLNVFTMILPPLRDRREDIPALARHFLEAAGKANPITDRSMQSLVSSNWPGNVRELKNSLSRAVVLAGDDPIEPFHLPTTEGMQKQDGGPAWELGELHGGSLEEQVATLEKTLIITALQKTGGVQSKAAALLGITQRSLWHRIKKHGLDPSALKGP